MRDAFHAARSVCRGAIVTAVDLFNWAASKDVVSHFLLLSILVRSSCTTWKDLPRNLLSQFRSRLEWIAALNWLHLVMFEWVTCRLCCCGAVELAKQTSSSRLDVACKDYRRSKLGTALDLPWIVFSLSHWFLLWISLAKLQRTCGIWYLFASSLRRLNGTQIFKNCWAL